MLMILSKRIRLQFNQPFEIGLACFLELNVPPIDDWFSSPPTALADSDSREGSAYIRVTHSWKQVGLLRIEALLQLLEKVGQE